MLDRRGFLTGLFSAFAAPAIVRASSIMPVKVMPTLAGLEEELQAEMGNLPNASALQAELSAVVRRAFVPRLLVQIYQASPLTSALLEGRTLA